MKKILLVEDTTEMNEMITAILATDYEVTSAFSGTEALLHFQNQSFDLVILDRMLPGKNGEEVLAEIRKSSQIPVIILTAITDQKEVAKLLIAGANDYLTKPFDIDELKARIIVQLRQAPQADTAAASNAELRFKNLQLLPNSFTIRSGEKQCALKRKEFEILQLLIQHPQKVYTKELLYETVWSEPYYGDENTINVHISNLRKKIKTLDPNNDYIETVWGLGIKLAEGGV